MIKITTGFLALIAFAGLVQAADPALTPAERAHAIQLLQDSQKEFLSYVDGLSAAQWNWKSAPERWSVGETAEHILLAEGLLFNAVQGAVASPVNPDWETKTKGKTEFIEKVMVDRSHKATAPEQIVPHGKMTREEVIQKYKEARATTLKFAEETQVALKEHTFEHPFPVFGTLNAYQWLIYVPLHNMRHNQQIAEVKATPGFPKE
ncbi:MAG TPA: DinB family protein [Bryobacteraceae bacterium]|nr:DinB family protein [Bryobacteraceae bacterium]